MNSWLLEAVLLTIYYENACRENKEEDIKDCKLAAEQNLKAVGIEPKTE